MTTTTILTPWTPIPGGLARYRVALGRCAAESVQWEFWARAIGWTSYTVARGSWTAAEQAHVDRHVAVIEAREG